jgi:dolichyl-phosphate-mannose--protein O-mannosyl transferase
VTQKWADQHPNQVEQTIPRNEFYIQKPNFETQTEKIALEKAMYRTNAGLEPTKDLKSDASLSMGFVDQPKFATKT